MRNIASEYLRKAILLHELVHCLHLVSQSCFCLPAPGNTNKKWLEHLEYSFCAVESFAPCVKAFRVCNQLKIEDCQLKHQSSNPPALSFLFTVCLLPSYALILDASPDLHDGYLGLTLHCHHIEPIYICNWTANTIIFRILFPHE